MRRTFLGFAVLILIMTMVAACGGSDSDDGDATTESTEAVTEAASSDEEATTESTEAEEADEEEPSATEASDSEATESEDEEAAATDEGADSGDEQVITWAAGVDITTLDGSFVVDLVSETFINLIFEKLIKLNPDYTVAPGLAETWETAEDGVTWTFEMRQDATFSNGNPVTAEAVKFSLDRVQDEATAAPNRSVLEGIAEVRVVDDYTVEIETVEPFPDLLRALADRAAIILDPEVVQQYDDPADVGQNPVGSGPYQVAEWEAGIGLTLERNPEYSGDAPEMDRIVYRAVPEAGTRMAMIQNNEADIISAPTIEDLSELEENPDVEVLSAEGIVMVTFEFLTDKAPLDNVQVRQALNHAVDNEAIVNELLQGYATVRCSTVTPAVGPEFYEEQDCYEYDPELARNMLAEAGYADGFEMDLWCPVGRYMKDREICEAVQFYFSEVGVTVNLETFDWATYTSLWSDPDRTMWMIGRGAGFTDFIFSRLFTKEQWDSGANNNTRYYNPEVEDLLTKARSTFDEEERAEYYHQVQEITWEFAPYIVLHTQNNIFAHRSNISGVEVIPNSVLVLENVVKE